jgi:UDP-glucose 4-epimerase
VRVLVTGAFGNLGRVVLPALELAGHDPVGFDFREQDSPYHVVAGDVRDADAVRRTMEGVDAVVHGAALHGVHLRAWRPEDFWEINATGTFNVYQAARSAGVRHVVLASTMGVYGESLRRTESAFAWTTEADPTLPLDVYGISKLMCEELGRFHARADEITTVALRFGMYVPGSFVHYGFRLLFGGVDDRDVADAVLRSLDHQPEGRFDAFNIMADVPFTPEDAPGMAADPEAVVERYWPGSRELFRHRGIEPREHIWGETLWPVDKAKRLLGYRPRHNFGEFLHALGAGDESYYAYADLPQWGVDGHADA